MTGSFRNTIVYSSIFVLILCNGGCNKTIDREIIRGNSIVTLKTKYIAWACGSNTPNVMPLSEIGPDIINEKIEYGFTFYVPSGLISPDNIDDLGVSGNVFVIRGFYYYSIIDNKKYLHPRFDLISWRPNAPFKIWDKRGSLIIKTNIDEYIFESNSNEEPEKFVKARKYDLCL